MSFTKDAGYIGHDQLKIDPVGMRRTVEVYEETFAVQPFRVRLASNERIICVTERSGMYVAFIERTLRKEE